MVSVIDGDTIRVSINGRREKVRLIGLDAPESKKPGVQVQCFAQKAASKMQSLVQSRSVRLAADPTQADRDRYGRLLRHVYTLDGRSVAAVLIRGGYARDYTYAAPYAGQADYRAAQQQAQSTHAGLWGACGGFPAEVPFAAAPAPDPKPKASATPTKKAAPRTPVKAAEPAKPQGSCDIKGNINDEGEKIYHVPGQQFYDKTKISPSKGERMFCSESDARDAGWRKAKV
ncbi:nuclease [Luteipulveratus halotolerans]|uniref:Nuclease n=1 Tax=Luteipulveratus halotolerans TaxID=1631356 RepID=A0A0L6CNH1_9MICO|nr:nuclease [Luteipulveratus halotolerans]